MRGVQLVPAEVYYLTGTAVVCADLHSALTRSLRFGGERPEGAMGSSLF